MLPTSTLPFVIVNAFTDRAFGGNPAVIILLPPGSFATDNALLDDSTMISVAGTFAQPITVFLSIPILTEVLDSDGSPVYDVRFVVSNYISPLCGHATFATTKAISCGMLPGVSQDVVKNPVFKFRTSGTVVSSRVLGPGKNADSPDGEFYEIVLPLCAMMEVEETEKDDIRRMVAKALRMDADKVGLKYLAHGVGGVISRLMVVLDSKETLEGRDIDIHAFLTGRFMMYTLTHATPGQKTAFVSRSFMPVIGVMEDHICGTAHGYMMPYYAAQPDIDVVAGKEVFVRQVGPRGGDLWVTLDRENEVVKLRGNGKLFAKGEITL
ncbi:hypothetical protein J3A83DRAFT_4265238 [Scleroderma citrinum]